MEVCASETHFWSHNNPDLINEDQVHLFGVIKRLVEHTTKYLNGFEVNNQKKIYKYKIDIWVGIINRIVNDLDSPIYIVKDSIISYFNALLEGFENVIVGFLFSNLEIQKIYKQIISLVLRLLINQIKIYRMRGKKNTHFRNYVTEEEVKSFRFTQEDILLRIYKRKEETFGDHQILNIAIKLYILIKNMSSQIKFYQLFLKEKDELSSNYLKGRIPKNQISNSKRNQILVHQFLKHIVEDIDIQIKIDDQWGGNIVYLQKLYFRKPAECFFLGQIRKNNFESKMDITSVVTKQRDLIMQVLPFSYVMVEQQKYFKKYRSFYFMTTEEFYKAMHYLLYFLSIVINILLLIAITFEHENDTKVRTSWAVIEDTTHITLIYIFGISIIGLSFLFSMMWLYFRWLIKSRQKYIEYEQKKAHMTKRDKFFIYFIRAGLLEARFRAFYLHFIFSLLGLVYNYIFYTMNLLLVANLSLTIEYVLMSIIRHWEKFLMTLLITIMVILFYSFLMLSYYADELVEDY